MMSVFPHMVVNPKPPHFEIRKGWGDQIFPNEACKIAELILGYASGRMRTVPVYVIEKAHDHNSIPEGFFACIGCCNGRHRNVRICAEQIGARHDTRGRRDASGAANRIRA